VPVAVNQETEGVAIYDCTHKGIKQLTEQMSESDIIIAVGECQLGDIEPDLTLPPENANEMVAEAIASEESSGDESDQPKAMD